MVVSKEELVEKIRSINAELFDVTIECKNPGNSYLIPIPPRGINTLEEKELTIRFRE